jgi:hypothetical protein
MEEQTQVPLDNKTMATLVWVGSDGFAKRAGVWRFGSTRDEERRGEYMAAR